MDRKDSLLLAGRRSTEARMNEMKHCGRTAMPERTQWPPTRLLACLVVAASAGCDSPADVTEPVGETFEPSLLGSAHVPYSMRETVALLDEQTACTIDTYETKIDCVDISGATVGHFGDKGDGPGEFLAPARVIRGTNGLLGFGDTSRRRFFVFTRTGELVAEVPLHMLSIFVPVSFSDATIIGTYTDGWGRGMFSGYMGDVMAAAEISLATGGVVREWKPANVPAFEGTLAVLVERQVGPDDSDGVPDRGIDWYDLGEF